MSSLYVLNRIFSVVIFAPIFPALLHGYIHPILVFHSYFIFPVFNFLPIQSFFFTEAYGPCRAPIGLGYDTPKK